MWTRLEVIENTAEGPSFERCQIESTLQDNRATHWRIFYGEVRADSEAAWAAIRSRSGCTAIASERAASPWVLRGSPYLLVDATVTGTAPSDKSVRLEAFFSIRRLTGFAKQGAPVYETRTEKRTLWVPDGGSAAVPILVADQKETGEFRVRELLLRFRAGHTGSGTPAEYGELGITADVPRAEILLDGGFAGRTSSGGPVVLRAVRVGEREVVIRDASGREARSVARVEKGRRADVALALLEAAASSPGGLRPLGRNRQGGEEFWREKDGAILVRIPGGEFQMGSPDTEGGANEHPQHKVSVKGFLMDKTEVTWGQYRKFATETNRSLPKPPVWGMPEALPASSVLWEDALAFCGWAGGRLPTEAEWERAARGDGLRRYPWGDDFAPWRCNTRDGGPHAPTAAGTYPDCVSPYGVLDLAGSVWEWCADWYDETYYSKSPVDNPVGPATGNGSAGGAPVRVSRGGDWMSPSFTVRSASREGIAPDWPDPTRGFRCVQDDGGGSGE